MTVVATAPGKLVLLGEYAVLDGAPSLVTAVDRRARVEVVPRAHGLVVTAPDIGVIRAKAHIDENRVVWDNVVGAETQARLILLKSCIECVSRERGPIAPMALTIQTSAFVNEGVKLGVGSSAAVATALVGALMTAAGVEPTSKGFLRRIFELALEAHATAQGKLGSGVDVAASSFGGTLQYVRGLTPTQTAEPSRREIPVELELIAVWSGHAAVTSKMVRGVKEYATQKPLEYSALINSLAAVAEEGCAAFAIGDVSEFLSSIDRYKEGLLRLGLAAGVDIVSETHQRMGAVVSAQGGVYKPSGAGGGDLGVAFAGSGCVATRVRAALMREGVTCLPIQFGANGLEVICHERTGLIAHS